MSIEKSGEGKLEKCEEGRGSKIALKYFDKDRGIKNFLKMSEKFLDISFGC